MNKTDQNLAEAFAGESQANRKYLAIAKQAERDGYPQAARLFRAAAAAETVHAHAHLRAMDGIRSTKENLAEALAGETHEFKNMYPDMINAAEEEGHKSAARSFRYANEVEQEHAALYQKALDNLEKVSKTSENVLPAVLEAVKARATVGEICDVWRKVFGEYRPKEFV